MGSLVISHIRICWMWVTDRWARIEGDWRIGWAMIEMLRIYSKGFLENVTIQGLIPWLFIWLLEQLCIELFSGAGANRKGVFGFIASVESHSSWKVSIFTYVPQASRLKIWEVYPLNQEVSEHGETPKKHRTNPWYLKMWPCCIFQLDIGWLFFKEAAT